MSGGKVDNRLCKIEFFIHVVLKTKINAHIVNMGKLQNCHVKNWIDGKVMQPVLLKVNDNWTSNSSKALDDLVKVNDGAMHITLLQSNHKLEIMINKVI